MSELKHIGQIKESVDFLNSNFPTKDSNKKFVAFLPNKEEGQSVYCWHISTDDYFLYNNKNEEFEICKKAIRKKFKNIKIVFCYYYRVSVNIKKKSGYKLVK